MPHHLIDVVDPDQDFSAADYARLARAARRRHRARAAALPIVAGGTGLYLRALLRGLFEGPSRDEALRRAAGGDRGAARRRAAAPPARARGPRGGGAHRGARPRARGARPRGVPRDAGARSARTTSDDAPRPLDGLGAGCVVGLDPPREALRAAVEARTRAMLAARARSTRCAALLARYAGRPAAAARDRLSAGGGGACAARSRPTEAQRDIVEETMRYAKRQMTWFRHQDDVRWFADAGEAARARPLAWTGARLMSGRFRRADRGGVRRARRRARRPTPPPSATRAATRSGTCWPRATVRDPATSRALGPRQPARPPSTARATPRPDGALGKMAERSAGKDTATGHWEMTGLVTRTPFRVYPGGLPAPRSCGRFEERIGRKVLGNKAASGTEILKELGEEHLRTGSPILYTSGDSVFQVAAHEDVIPPDELYRICRIGYEIACLQYGVCRVIARPFVGTHAATTSSARRTAATSRCRRAGETLLDRLAARGLARLRRGQDRGHLHRPRGSRGAVHTTSGRGRHRPDPEGHGARSTAGLIFTNLVDFDTLYGHRNDVAGLRAQPGAAGRAGCPRSSAACARTTSSSSPPTTAATPPTSPPTTPARTCRCSSAGRGCGRAATWACATTLRRPRRHPGRELRAGPAGRRDLVPARALTGPSP